MATNVSLRAAEPTVEEGRRFAGYADTAAHGLMRTLFGPDFERIIAEAFVSPGHDLSYDTAVFAEQDGRPIGMTSSFSAERHRGSTNAPVVRAAGWQVLRMVPFSVLAFRFLAFVGTIPDGDWYVQAIAVDGEARGTGVGSLLLDDVEERAAAAGSRRLALDVAADNDGARRLYERRGMTVESESPAILFRPDQRVFRMVKPL